jgi:hypothetical protein
VVGHVPSPPLFHSQTGWGMAVTKYLFLNLQMQPIEIGNNDFPPTCQHHARHPYCLPNRALPYHNPPIPSVPAPSLHLTSSHIFREIALPPQTSPGKCGEEYRTGLTTNRAVRSRRPVRLDNHAYDKTARESYFYMGIGEINCHSASAEIGGTKVQV